MPLRLTSKLFPQAAIRSVLIVAPLLLSSFTHATRGRASIASGGAVARSLAGRTAADEPTRADIRRRLSERARGTFINDMLAERDSTLSRWADISGSPLLVWVQPFSAVAGWEDSYIGDVKSAFRQWDSVQLPVQFAFTTDSADADVHVNFVHHFDEEISGRTKWGRDDDWYITSADIVLAVYHRGGPILDDDAMHAMTLHEIGHLLGLDHTSDSASIMAPRVRVRALSPADRATARLLYTLPPGGVR